MANDGIIAAAQGNAAAIVNVIESAPPGTCPFDLGPLTPGMEALHMINNVDILELAEEIAKAESDIVTAHTPKTRSELDLGRAFDAEGRITAAQKRIVDLEQEIAHELDEAQNEYRALTQALCSGRQEYVEARRRVGLDDNLPSQGELSMMRSRREGVGPGYRPELNHNDLETVEKFEETLAAYHALESGFHHMTTKEQWTIFFNFLVVELATEVVTAGLGKYVKGIRALDGAMAFMLERAGKAVISRYGNLPDGVKERLRRIFARRHGEERVKSPGDGNTGTGASRGRADIGCSAAACAL